MKRKCELPLANIRSRGGEVDRLKKSEKSVEIIGEVLMRPSPKLGSPYHSSFQETNLSVHRCGWIHDKQVKIRYYLFVC